MIAQRIFRVVGVAAVVSSAALSGPIEIPSADADPCPAVEVVFARGTGQSSGVGQVGQAFIDTLGPPYSAKTIDECADGDPACSSGGNVFAHGSYV